MAQDLTQKQTGFVQRYSATVAGLLNTVDALITLDKEFADNAYGTGGANAITDPIVEAVLPASSAELFNSGQASTVSVLDAVASVRSSLEWMRN